MREVRKQKSEPSEVQALSRRLRDLRTIVVKLRRSRMSPLQLCQSIIENRLIDPEVRAFFSGLPNEERHYWIASLYALRMTKTARRRLAAYFTPPHLAQHAVDALLAEGIRPGHDRILDPASGGAAFLVPLADRIAQNGRRTGVTAKALLSQIHSTVHGIEIDAGLANLSRALLISLFREEIKSSGIDITNLVRRANTLEIEAPKQLYDAIIGNPPYGRILRPSKSMLRTFSPVISAGYVNLYALFVEQALRLVRPGGVICLIIPVSFVGGPYFARLRQRILEEAFVVRLDLIDKRSDVFVDVLYDLCVLVLRKRGRGVQAVVPKTSVLFTDKPAREVGTLELPTTANGDVWALPDENGSSVLFNPGFVTLADYGYLAKTGYFVWNREKDRYRVGKKPRSTEVPLFWAQNVQAGERCTPRDGKDRIGFVKISGESSAVIRTDAVLLQRTSNRGQKRRLIAAVVRKSAVPGKRGFVTENHTIVIIPDPAKPQAITLTMLCRLLNTEPVDSRFRRMSGSVSVSTIALRDLPLPKPADVRDAFAKLTSDDEAAAAAYIASSKLKASSRREKTSKKPLRRSTP